MKATEKIKTVKYKHRWNIKKAAEKYSKNNME